MNYGNIKFCDIADGEGVRTSLFVSGCKNHCKLCFNPETWDFNYGQEFTDVSIKKIMDSLKPSYISGLTLLGGEPMEVENQDTLANLVTLVKESYPQKNIWVYTGYLFDKDLKKDGKRYTNYTDQFLSCVDIIVDGKFDNDLKDLSLQFRGSKNQRIINVQESLKKGSVVTEKRFK
jgi:anaerobic ribonucleoside-triphosphate reductase activating protein